MLEEANHGICPNQGMNQRTEEIFRVDLWSLEVYLGTDALIIPLFHPSILWWRGLPPSKCPPVGHLYDGGRFGLPWRGRSIQIFN